VNTAEITAPCTFVPSPQQAAYFDWLQNGRGSAIMEAVAGAGKTTTLIEGAERMVGSVTFVAFNNKIAREIGEKLVARGHQTYGRSGKAARTFHSVGFKMLRETFPQAPWARDPKDAQYLTDKKVIRICEKLIFEKQRRDLEGLEAAVASMVGMAKNRGIGVFCAIDDEHEWRQMVDHFALDEALPEGKEDMVPQLIKMAQICLKRSTEQFMDCIDYDDMIYLPLVRNLRVKWQSDWVLIDEAQDTNPTRRAIAKKMLRPGGRLVAVGDPHQAIYGFTGTDNNSLEQIAEEFGCRRLPLTVTYRCPKAVVRVAHNYVDHIQAHESAPEGTVEHYQYADVLDHVQLGDAVLCRFNKYLVSLVFRLIRGGVAAKIEGRAIGSGLVKLATRWKSIKTLNALEAKLTEHNEREIAKAKVRDDDRKIDELNDRHETMQVLIERAREQGLSTVAELSTMIMSIFEDAERLGDTSKIVTLCSVHRSKGLEWERVHVLGLNEVMPARCSRAWQEAQELNLQYVAVTRAKSELHIVGGLA
jgi:superfamily I DNA/RNA helicase